MMDYMKKSTTEFCLCFCALQNRCVLELEEFNYKQHIISM